MFGKLCVLAVVLAALHGSQAATINTAPTNSSGLLGANATLYCEVTGTQAQGEVLQWRKGDGSFIGNDGSPTNTTKYEVVDRYRLYIKDLVMSDEDSYQCTLFPDTFTAYIVVSDPPTSATLKWSNNEVWTPKDETSNLTCTSTTSRPPASFRWFKGSSEVSNTAINPVASTDASGYGTSMSMLQLTPSSSDEGSVYTCHVDVPGGSSYVQKTLTVSFSGAGHIAASFAVLIVSIFASLRL